MSAGGYKQFPSGTTGFTGVEAYTVQGNRIFKS